MAYQGNQELSGLWPVGNGVAGTAPRIHHYAVDASYAATIGEGCLLIKVATGVQLATATVPLGQVIGVAAGNSAATNADTIPVYDDPQQEYVVVADALYNSTVAIEMIGQFAAPLTNTYNATLAQANTQLDISVVGTATTTLCMQVVNAITNVGETTSASFSQVRVTVAPRMHVFSSYATTRAT